MRLSRNIVSLFLLSAVSASAVPIPEEHPINGSIMPDKHLLIHAVRYADTPLRKENKAAAREELKKRLPGSFTSIMERLHQENGGLTVWAMELVLETDEDALVDSIEPFLDSPHPFTKKMAVYFLSFKQAERLIPDVRPLLEDDNCRGVAIRALSKWKDYESLEIIGEFMSHTNERIRVAAANALREFRHPAGMPYLIRGLSDDVFTVRNTAARALNFYMDEAVPLLDGMFHTETDPAAIRQAFRCLGVIGTRASIEVYERWAAVMPSYRIQREKPLFLHEPRSEEAVSLLLEPPLF